MCVCLSVCVCIRTYVGACARACVVISLAKLNKFSQVYVSTACRESLWSPAVATGSKQGPVSALVGEE